MTRPSRGERYGLSMDATVIRSFTTSSTAGLGTHRVTGADMR
jgi:hypothetical protein